MRRYHCYYQNQSSNPCLPRQLAIIMSDGGYSNTWILAIRLKPECLKRWQRWKTMSKLETSDLCCYPTPHRAGSQT